MGYPIVFTSSEKLLTDNEGEPRAVIDDDDFEITFVDSSLSPEEARAELERPGSSCVVLSPSAVPMLPLLLAVVG
jgi:hypothetical protein